MQKMLFLLTWITAIALWRVGLAAAGWQWMNPQTTNQDLYDVWGASEQDVFFVGAKGTIVHWDGGTNWQQMHSGVSEDLWCVWGFSANDVFVGGDDGIILRWNGTAWQKMESDCSCRIKAMWGSSANDLWAVACWSVLHWNGQSWNEVYEDPVGYPLNDVWGLGPQDLYVAGDHGILLHWNGIELEDIFDLEYSVHGVWASADNDIHIITSLDPARFYHWDGTSWKLTFSMKDSLVRCIWGVSAEEAYCAGQILSAQFLCHWDGTSWIIGSVGRPVYLGGITGRRAFAVGQAGFAMECVDGAWIQLGTLTNAYLNGAWAANPEDVYVVGSQGTILHYDGITWTFMDNGGITSGFIDIWGTSPDNLFAVGGNNIIHYNGTSWSSMECPAEIYLESIHGISSDFVFAVGYHSLNEAAILSWDGKTWTQMPFQADTPLLDVYVIAPDCAVAVGFNGLIARWDGITWTQQVSPTTEKLDGVWGDSPDHVIAVGSYRTAVHWDGTDWRVKPYPAGPGGSYLYEILGNAPDDVYAVGGSWSLEHVMMHWDGLAWSSILTEDGAIFYGFCRLDERRFLVVGQYGSIVLWDGESPLGVRISVPIENHSGEIFGVRGYLDNPGTQIERAAVFFAIEYDSAPYYPERYWFWPGWEEYDENTGSGLDYRIMSVPHGVTQINVVPEFLWPAHTYLFGGCRVYGVMLNPETGEVLGEMGIAGFSASMYGSSSK